MEGQFINDTKKIHSTLTFNHVSYSVSNGNEKGNKTILKELSGRFKSGELTAILGPSGAGKTSLMNILAGFKISGTEADLQVDGCRRDSRSFRKMAAYITQKDHLLLHLSINEYMNFAAQLKLGNAVDEEEQTAAVERVMKMLGLSESRHTRVSCLSGGECKRLSIALELVNNPSILFVDEPTSGLDSASSLQCIELLRQIAHSGRTVVATIHQPSSRLLEMFDHLYILSGGKCMYQGSVADLVPFLATRNLICPNYHNPADFVMDVAAAEHGEVSVDLVDNVNRSVYHETNDGFFHDDVDDGSSNEDSTFILNDGRKLTYATTFARQVAILLRRTFISICREKMLTMLRFAAHVVVGIMMSLLYLDVGNDASRVYNNVGLLFFNQLFLMFTAMMPTVLTFPLERQVLVREHLNNWYSLKAYYVAKTLADMPFQIVFPLVYLLSVYFITSQPLSGDRFLMVLAISVGTSSVAQGVGLLVGAAANIQVAVFLAPAVTIPFLLFSGFFVSLNAIPGYMSWIPYFSFMRYAFEGSMVAVYGFERPPLDCSLPYCHFRFPVKILQQFDMQQSRFMCSFMSLLVAFFVIRLVAYLALKWKLRHIR